MSTIALAMLAHSEAEYLPVIWENIGHRLSAAVILSDPPNDDNTMEVAKSLFGHLPGKIAERPWPESSSIARNEVIAEARQYAEYVLWLDPDSPIVGHIPDDLTAPAYEVETLEANIKWWITHLIKYNTPATWIGRCHEYLSLTVPSTRLDTCHVLRSGSGSGIINHIPLLLQDITDDPDNARWPFYLAQSYKDIGQIDNAIAWYIHRSSMIGFVEETFISMYYTGKLLMGRDNDEAEKWLLRAYAYRPTRHEPLVQLAWLYHCSGKEHMAATINSQLSTMPLTTDNLFVEIR